jgi:hypothetical protein
MCKWSETIPAISLGDEESHGELRIVGFIVEIQNRDL